MDGICVLISVPHPLDNGREGIIKKPVNYRYVRLFAMPLITCHVIGWGEAGFSLSLFSTLTNLTTPRQATPNEAGIQNQLKFDLVAPPEV